MHMHRTLDSLFIARINCGLCPTYQNPLLLPTFYLAKQGWIDLERPNLKQKCPPQAQPPLKLPAASTQTFQDLSPQKCRTSHLQSSAGIG